MSPILARRRKTVRLTVVISEELNEQLRKHVVLKHQKYEKGLLSFEVETGIINLMESYKKEQTAHTQINENDSWRGSQQQFKVNQLKEQIILYLHQKHNLVNPTNISETSLNDAICYLKGIDPRTVKKWKMLLLHFKCIKRKISEGAEHTVYEFLSHDYD